MASPWTNRGGYYIRTITWREFEEFKRTGTLPEVGFLSSTKTPADDDQADATSTST